MIRLTREQASGGVVIRVDGSLTGDAVEELHRAAAAETGGITLNLDGLTSLDDEGRALLGVLRDRGHRLSGGSLYIRRLLRETQS